ncbi:UPF0182 family membrane protein [Acidaminobacter hydrogenoformans]|uniref:UPF0182 protein SAMN03080599_02668 n=1 Tax=Acidaminobacter hydrogenoformans DSM 2784 TaxID=1120920 RepID=A0A1G5S4D0_9FIRM|nr:UPF0182 family protein [Acidaminobacter hydrogenoformans]SCZ81225.1 hypothetical protein SAMN03080599_02668 [Acidaminobacter hydrogenoformans DSM 2784]
MKKELNKIVPPLIAALLLLFISSDQILGFIANYQWFKMLGYTQTFFVEIKTKMIMWIPLSIALAVALSLYFLKIFEKYIKLGQIFISKPETAKSRTALVLASTGLGLFLSWVATNELWLKVLFFLNRTEFGVSDPIFNNDAAFYIFSKPLMENLMSLGIFITLVIIIATLVFYSLVFKKYPPSEGTVYYLDRTVGIPNVIGFFKKDILRNAVKRIATLGAIFFVLLGLFFLIMTYDLVYSPRGAAFGASYTDVAVTLKGYIALAITSFISAVLFFVGLIKEKRRLILAGPAAIVFIGLLTSVIAFGVQRLIVEPDEISKEQPYIEYNIAFTQKSFQLDNVESREFPVDQELTAQDLKDNEATIRNIRINDETPLLQTFNQLQSLRLYYQFSNISMDRYTIDGQYRQIFLAPRELNVDKLTEKAKTWINLHLKYTHGYGVVVAPVNEVTPEGQPKLMVKNIPPTTETDLKLLRPEIYFGLMTDQYIITGTDEDEFDYPSGSDNTETRYQGKDGISLKGLNRLLYAVTQRSMRLLFSDNITSESKIHHTRDVIDRAAKIAPFLVYEHDPYLVMNQEDGKLYWIVDAYTATADFPYSQRYGFKGYIVNYVRNSVKIVVDAYEGTIDYYVYDENDPMVKTYQKIYKDLFKPVSEFPDGLKAHIKYPRDLFDLQAEVYRLYHITNPVVFYNGEDAWDIANEKYLDQIQEAKSNYVMFKLPEEQKEEFALILPYTPREKANMTSLLVARNDGENYGKLYVYRFPKDKTIDGPMMIESRIDQDSTISPQFTLWGQEGSNVLRGNVIVVPVNNSLLYIEPIFIQADNVNSLPETKRVIVGYRDKVVMEQTLEMALERIFGPESALPGELPSESDQPSLEGDNLEAVLDRVKSVYDELSRSLAEIQRLIQQLETQRSSEGTATEEAGTPDAGETP